ncbi:hypothetical protein HID58_066352 [Brassica napus]|uniref:Uncharacterized protein n=1 Tax=Brassica napus TaxID=3708 RepID=A0ABQ7ZFF3_BRANA|nr:hypothetical protein HID58_066352 [Brassica napus]
MMIMAMEKVDGETSAECRERCSQSCAMTEALPAKCLQSCYRRCQGLPSHTIAISIVLPEDRLSTKS